MISVYSDGSSSGGSDKPGGYGWVILRDGVPLYSGCGGDPATTNNVMELTGAIKGLEALLTSGLLELDKTIELVSDSQYVLGIGSGEFSPTKNLELAHRLRGLVSQTGAACRWVRGHDNEPWNCRCDSLARKGKESCMPPEAVEAKYARQREKQAKSDLRKRGRAIARGVSEDA